MEYQVLAYYSITPLEDPHAEVARHKEFMNQRDCKGRIYISEQGINGQASASLQAAEEYIAWMRSDARFRGIDFKIHRSTDHVFPKMTIKYRRQLVAIDCEVDFSQRGVSLSPREWKKMLEKRSNDTLLLDVRNDYEWQVGHFEGAELPSLDTFRQFPTFAKQLKQTRDPQKTTVMMYCTGGIRCEFFSPVLKQAGFENVYQLDGGVIGYGLQEKNDHWKGKLFVFDDRLVVPISADAATPIAVCKHCTSPCDVYHNCANMDCNELFLSCPNCLKKTRGCCSAHCLDEGRIRPYQENGKPFRKWEFQAKKRLKQNRSDAASVSD